MTDPTRIDITFDPRERRMRGTATHGMTPFDVPFISHVEGNLWQGGCANGLVLPTDIEHVVSLYKWERYTVEHELRSFTEITAYDSADGDGEALGGMSIEQVLAIAATVNEACETGVTLVHCQAGLNRSGLIAATALVLSGTCATGAEAVALIRERRSPAVLCNPAFESWLVRHFA